MPTQTNDEMRKSLQGVLTQLGQLTQTVQTMLKVLEPTPPKQQPPVDKTVTPLMQAIFNNDTAAAKKLISTKGTDLDAESSTGVTALIYAAIYGNKELVQALIDRGADQLKRDQTGRRAVDYARANNHGEVAIILEAILKPAARLPNFEFVIPKGSAKGAFNAANTITGRALPNYMEEEDTKPANLVDVAAVLKALAAPGIARSNRKSIYPYELEDYLPDEWKGKNIDRWERESMDMIEGKSKVGLGLTILKAAGADGKETYLYVLDDQERQKIMVLGAADVGKPFADQLARNGVVYARKSDPASIKKINDFVADCARYRGSPSTAMAQMNTQNVIENFIRSFSALCEIQDEPGGIMSGSTLGSILHANKGKPTVYTSIVKPSAK